MARRRGAWLKEAATPAVAEPRPQWTLRRRRNQLWVGCIAGALDEREFRIKLATAGFEDIGIEPIRVYQVDDAREFLAGKGINVEAVAKQIDGKFMSAFVCAAKPGKPASGNGPTTS